MRTVIDTSVILAVLFGEKQSGWCIEQFRLCGENGLCMSTVNLAETLILLKDRLPHDYPAVRAQLLTYAINFVPPDAIQAEIAAAARCQYPINLGDCFAYALAKSELIPLLTLDRDFLKTDVEVIIPEKR